jgi:hypothetical protein
MPCACSGQALPRLPRIVAPCCSSTSIVCRSQPLRLVSSHSCTRHGRAAARVRDGCTRAAPAAARARLHCSTRRPRLGLLLLGPHRGPPETHRQAQCRLCHTQRHCRRRGRMRGECWAQHERWLQGLEGLVRKRRSRSGQSQEQGEAVDRHAVQPRSDGQRSGLPTAAGPGGRHRVWRQLGTCWAAPRLCLAGQIHRLCCRDVAC